MEETSCGRRDVNRILTSTSLFLHIPTEHLWCRIWPFAADAPFCKWEGEFFAGKCQSGPPPGRKVGVIFRKLCAFVGLGRFRIDHYCTHGISADQPARPHPSRRRTSLLPTVGLTHLAVADLAAANWRPSINWRTAPVLRHGDPRAWRHLAAANLAAADLTVAHRKMTGRMSRPGRDGSQPLAGSRRAVRRRLIADRYKNEYR